MYTASLVKIRRQGSLVPYLIVHWSFGTIIQYACIVLPTFSKTYFLRRFLHSLFLLIQVSTLQRKSIYIYFACLFVCLAVCLYPMNVKTAELIGPKFCVGPYVTPGKVYEWTKFQKFVFKSFLFFEILKMREKILWNPQTFFFCTKRRCSQIKPQLKVEIGDEREAP